MIETRILGALRTGVAVVPLGQLARRLAISGEALASPVADLVNAGTVDLWPDAEDGPSVVLSPLTAARLGLALDATMRWVPAGKRDRRTWPEKRDRRTQLETEISAEGRASLLDGQADPRAEDPAIVAERAEAAYLMPPARKPTRATATYAATGKPPEPSIFIGSTTPWGAWPEGAPCPCCAGRPLAVREYCLRCSASGYDGRGAFYIEQAGKVRASAKQRGEITFNGKPLFSPARGVD